MSGYLLDTHIWFWHVEGSERLPAGARRLIEAEPETCWYSPVSVWELGALKERGRLDLLPDARRWVEEALEILSLREAPFTTDVALRVPEVDLPHRDPADRFLAATALHYDLTLLTVDRRLTEARDVPTRSG